MHRARSGGDISSLTLRAPPPILAVPPPAGWRPSRTACARIRTMRSAGRRRRRVVRAGARRIRAARGIRTGRVRARHGAYGRGSPSPLGEPRVPGRRRRFAGGSHGRRCGGGGAPVPGARTPGSTARPSCAATSAAGRPAGGDAELDFFLRDASMDVGDGATRPRRATGWGTPSCATSCTRRRSRASRGRATTRAPRSSPPSLGSLGSLGQLGAAGLEGPLRGRRRLRMRSIVAAAASRRRRRRLGGPRRRPRATGMTTRRARGPASMGPAAARSGGSGPDVGTSFPACATAADVVERALSRVPSRGASSNAGLALAHAR